MDAADAVQWQNWTRDLGWRVIAPEGAPGANIDQRVQSLAAAVVAAIRDGSVDPARVYLAGRGDAAAAVFYAISRVPDLWAAGAALGGSPKAALDTNRVFAANFTNVPVIWLAGDDAKPLVEKLTAAKLNVDWQSVSGGANAAGVMQWLAQHKREAFPLAIDCETNSPTFASCYWIQMTKFDPAERNDVLASTRSRRRQRRRARSRRLRLQDRRPRPRRPGHIPARKIQRPAQDGRPPRRARRQAHR